MCSLLDWLQHHCDLLWINGIKTEWIELKQPSSTSNCPPQWRTLSFTKEQQTSEVIQSTQSSAHHLFSSTPMTVYSQSRLKVKSNVITTLGKSTEIFPVAYLPCKLSQTEKYYDRNRELLLAGGIHSNHIVSCSLTIKIIFKAYCLLLDCIRQRCLL